MELGFSDQLGVGGGGVLVVVSNFNLEFTFLNSRLLEGVLQYKI